jgi:hypothetical protein
LRKEKISLLTEQVQNFIPLQKILVEMMVASVTAEDLQREMEPIVGTSAILGALMSVN